MFLVLFGLITLVIHALQRSASGRAMLAVRSTEVAAEASGVARQPHEDHDLRPVGRHRRLRRRAARHVQLQLQQHERAALYRTVLARARGDVRDPPPGGALLAGFALAAGPAVFHWIADSDLLGGGTAAALIASIYFVPILSGSAPSNSHRSPTASSPSSASSGSRRSARRTARRGSPRRRPWPTTASVPEHEVLHTRRGRRCARITAAGSPNGDALAEHDALRWTGVVAGYGDAEVLHGVVARTRVRQGGRVARRQRRRQVDAVLGRRRDSSTPTFGTVAARRDGRHPRRRRTSARAPACCSSRRRGASSPA